MKFGFQRANRESKKTVFAMVLLSLNSHKHILKCFTITPKRMNQMKICECVFRRRADCAFYLQIGTWENDMEWRLTESPLTKAYRKLKLGSQQLLKAESERSIMWCWCLRGVRGWLKTQRDGAWSGYMWM